MESLIQTNNHVVKHDQGDAVKREQRAVELEMKVLMVELEEKLENVFHLM